MATADGESAKVPDHDRSKRIYVLWGVGFAFLATLGAFCWLVVKPVMEVHSVMKVYGAHDINNAEAVKRLGGCDSAFRKLRLYLAMPSRLATHRGYAASLLGCCGPQAIDPLAELLKDPGSDVRYMSSGRLLEFRSQAGRAAPALVRACQREKEPGLRAAHLDTLGYIGPAAAEVAPDVEKFLPDPNSYVRSEAALTLWRITGRAEKSLPVLVQELASAEPRDRSFALERLKWMGPAAKAALPAIEKLAVPTEPAFVCRAAQEAIESIRAEKSPP